MAGFGTGCLARRALHSFPFDKVRIDRGFIRDLSHDRNPVAIIRAIAAAVPRLIARHKGESLPVNAAIRINKVSTMGAAIGPLDSPSWPNQAARFVPRFASPRCAWGVYLYMNHIRDEHEQNTALPIIGLVDR
jgi:predicted signal transduction protein with EAL and GGDEF domain